VSNELPQEGQWYRHLSDEAFFVIAVHEDEDAIDVRDEYGDVDELSFQEWDRMNLELCNPPPGWTDHATAHESGNEWKPSFPVD
jgi:hypothetical protein